MAGGGASWEGLDSRLRGNDERAGAVWWAFSAAGFGCCSGGRFLRSLRSVGMTGEVACMGGFSRMWGCQLFELDAEIVNRSPIGVDDMVQDDRGCGGSM